MKNIKLLKVILIMCFVCLFIVIFLFIKDISRYKNFCYVSAEIVNVYSVSGEHNHTNMKKRYFVEYRYTMNGVEYKTNKQVYFKSGKNIGDIVNIKYNPKNPSEIQNTYSYYAKIGGIIFIGVFTILLCIIIFRNKKH